jgi:hypothetical protein
MPPRIDDGTQQKINAVKKQYCQDLETARLSIENLKILYDANDKMYEGKQRRYLSTKENFERYNNTEISMGSQLVQANEKIKAGVTAFKTVDDSLAAQLVTIFQSVKDVKAKIGSLRDAATLLSNSKKDSCNSSQWSAITGAAEGQQAGSCQCEDIEEAIDILFYMPDALVTDIDSVFKSSSDIIGIQKFCNTGSIVGLQQTLYDQATAFDQLLLATVALRKTDLDARQKELKDALAARTGSVMDLYTQRNGFGAIHSSLNKLCFGTCDCVSDDADVSSPRLEDCTKKICEICGKMKLAFVHEGDAAPAAPQP